LRSEEAHALDGLPNGDNEDPERAADAALVERLRGGDANAFAEIVRAWSPRMLQAARAYVSTDASAQEVVQDTWLAMIRGLGNFEGRSSLRTWILAILSNISRSRGAREARTLPWSSLRPRTPALLLIRGAFAVRMTNGKATGRCWAGRDPGQAHPKRRS
jgi:DNA-directed RNA polymerase specialized sigma24 family protein